MPQPNTSALMLLIDKDDGKGRKMYYVSRIRDTPAIPGPAWRLRQSSGLTYDVAVHDDGPRCECKGYLRHSHCKHIDALGKESLLGD